jgi:hypothetical protein
MDNLHIGSDGVVQPVPHRGIEQEIIPETFPTWAVFLKTVGLGLLITMAQFGLLILLVAKSSH